LGPIGPALAAAARIVLAVTLIIAAIGKLRARHELPAQLRAFGIPKRAVRPIAIALPLVELAVAGALIGWWESAVPAWAAVALLAVFTAGLVRAVARGAPCPCFGAASSGPASAASIVRNAVLLALAVIATGTPKGAKAAAVVLGCVVLGAIVAAVVVVSDGAGRRAGTQRH
jgi:hypothetical protein